MESDTNTANTTEAQTPSEIPLASDSEAESQIAPESDSALEANRPIVND
jgi:hypothetical protein